MQLKIVLPEIYHLISTFTNDKEIMAIALDLRIFNTTQLKEFNTVRIYLQVVFLSDLIHLRTNKVKRCYIEGRRD